MKILRRAGFAFFGVFNGTEVNPNFASEVEEVLSSGGFEHGKETPVVLLCYCGGSLDPTVSMKNGKQSRSAEHHLPGFMGRIYCLQNAYRLLEGYASQTSCLQFALYTGGARVQE